MTLTERQVTLWVLHR